METGQAVLQLGALAQESRLAIFRLLVRYGDQGLCVGDIQTQLSLPPATLSFHLKELSRAGLIQARQQGRFIFYAAALPAMNALLAYLSEQCCSQAGTPSDCPPPARCGDC